MDKTQEIVLPSADWERIQSLLNQPKPKVYTRQEVVDINAQREFGRAKKRLMKPLAQKPSLVEKQKQANKEYWDRLVAEEAEFKEQERQQTIERSNFMRLLQDDRARQFNSVLQVIQATKENEVLIKINRTRQRIEEEKRQKKEISREHEEALRQEQRQKQENACQRRLAKQTLDAFNLQQVKEKQQLRKKEIQLEKQSFNELHTEQPRDKQEPKLRCLKSTLEDIANKKLHREMEARKLEEEEKEIMHVHCDIEQKLQQRKNDQAEKFRKHQIAVQTVSDNLAALKKKQEAAATAASEMALSKGLAKKEAKLAKEQKQKEEQRAAMLKSISAHREAVIQEKEQMVKAERESRRSQESDRLFLERQKQKAQRIRENNMMVRRINETIVEEKLRHEEQLQVEEYEAELKNIAQTAERSKQLQQYTQDEINKAAENPKIHNLLIRQNEKYILHPKPVMTPAVPRVDKNSSAAKDHGSNYVSAGTGRLLSRCSQIKTLNFKLQHYVHKEIIDLRQNPGSYASAVRKPQQASAAPSYTRLPPIRNTFKT